MRCDLLQINQQRLRSFLKLNTLFDNSEEFLF